MITSCTWYGCLHLPLFVNVSSIPFESRTGRAPTLTSPQNTVVSRSHFIIPVASALFVESAWLLPTPLSARKHLRWPTLYRCGGDVNSYWGGKLCSVAEVL